LFRIWLSYPVQYAWQEWLWPWWRQEVTVKSDKSHPPRTSTNVQTQSMTINVDLGCSAVCTVPIFRVEDEGSMFLIYILVSHRGGPGSRPGQSIWDLWWTKWHWDRFLSEFFGFYLSYHSTVALQTHIIWGMRNMLT
jgi:hypothetical protein